MTLAIEIQWRNQENSRRARTHVSARQSWCDCDPLCECFAGFRCERQIVERRKAGRHMGRPLLG